MKLISLQLYNFRQFYGKTPQIKFASGTENTTVIHGNNGAGKTALLNSIAPSQSRKQLRIIPICLRNSRDRAIHILNY